MKWPALCFYLLLACGTSHEGDDPPPTGNQWVLTPEAGCQEQATLLNIAAAYCAPYGQRPVVTNLGAGCLVWYIGVAGPYAVPGVASMVFACR